MDRQVYRRSKEDLIRLLRFSGGLLTAMDGLWFLAVEAELGNSDAVKLDIRVWEKYAHVLVKRIRNEFGLSGAGIPQIRQLVELDPLFLNLDYDIPEFSEERMILRVTRCPVLEAMEKAGRTKFICESTTGLYFNNVAKEIDARIKVSSLRLPPRSSPRDVCCEWLYQIDAADLTKKHL